MRRFKYLLIATAIIFATSIAATAQTAAGDSTFIKRLQDDGQVKIEMPEELYLRLLPGSYQSPVDKTGNSTGSASTLKGSRAGYKIQALIDNGSNAKQACNSRARNISSRFPELSTKLDYRAPGWRLLVGDFANVDQAKKMLSQLKQSFPAYAKDFIIVKAQVYIR